MLEISKRYIEVHQDHIFLEKSYSLQWRGQCVYSPRVGEEFEFGCLMGRVKSVANTIFNEGLLVDFGASVEEVLPSQLVWKTTVLLTSSPFKNPYRIEDIFNELPGAGILSSIESFDMGENSWRRTTGWLYGDCQSR